MNPRLKRYGKRFASLLFWLLIWQGLSMLVGKELLLPAPYAVLRRLLALAGTGEFWRTAAVSVLRVLCGVMTAAALGILLAALAFRSPALEALIAPPLAAIKATPVVSFIILALLWMGRDVLPAFIAALIVLPVVLENTAAGLRAVDPALLEVARVFRFSHGKTVFRIYAPSVMPYLLSALRGSFGMGWKAGIAAEVLTSPAVSIGRMLSESKLYLETADLFAWTAAAVLLSLLFERLLTAAVAGLSRKFRWEVPHD